MKNLKLKLAAVLVALLIPTLAFATVTKGDIERLSGLALRAATAVVTTLTATTAGITTANIATANVTTAFKVNTTSGTSITAIRFVSDTVASGQTAKTATLTGVTASSKCVASPNEIPTNAGYIKSVAAGTDQVVVTVNTDPGASNLDFTVMCLN